MSASTLVVRIVGRLLRSRTLMRLPIHLYRARLGFLLGDRLLMLEHRGRRTGARRRVVLEVIGHPAPDVYVVASGFGRRAQWFRNVAAEPLVRLSTGWRGLTPATARILTAAEADDALRTYTTRHPRAWNTIRPALQHTLGSPITRHDTPLPMVELRRRPDRTDGVA